MTDVKKYLKQIALLDEDIKTCELELEELREFSTSISSANLQSASKSNLPSDKVSNTVTKIMDLEDKIRDKMDIYINLKIDVYNKINEMESREEKLLLQYKYLQFNTWEQIADRLNYSIRNIYYIHNKALKNFDIINK